MEEEEEVILTNEQVIEIAAEGYGDTIPGSLEEARKHTLGDTLADFIVIELLDAEGDPFECMKLMEQAAEDLMAVAKAFEKRL